MPNLLRRIWYIAAGRRQEMDLADEMSFHREMKAQELRDAGMSEAEVKRVLAEGDSGKPRQ